MEIGEYPPRVEDWKGHKILIGTGGEPIVLLPVPIDEEGRRIHEKSIEETLRLNKKFKLTKQLKNLSPIEKDLFLLNLHKAVLGEQVIEHKQGSLMKAIERSLADQEKKLEGSPIDQRDINLRLHTAAVSVKHLIDQRQANSVPETLASASEDVLAFKTKHTVSPTT